MCGSCYRQSSMGESVGFQGGEYISGNRRDTSRAELGRTACHGKETSAWIMYRKGERTAVREMRAHASRYFHGLPKATVLRREIMKALTEEEFGRILTGYEMELGLEEPEA